MYQPPPLSAEQIVLENNAMKTWLDIVRVHSKSLKGLIPERPFVRNVLFIRDAKLSSWKDMSPKLNVVEGSVRGRDGLFFEFTLPICYAIYLACEHQWKPYMASDTIQRGETLKSDVENFKKWVSSPEASDNMNNASLSSTEAQFVSEFSDNLKWATENKWDPRLIYIIGISPTRVTREIIEHIKNAGTNPNQLQAYLPGYINRFKPKITTTKVLLSDEPALFHAVSHIFVAESFSCNPTQKVCMSVC